MRNYISRSSRLSSIVRLKRLSTGVQRGFSRAYPQGQYIQPYSYFPQGFPQPTYPNNDIPWSQHSRWVRWPSYLCAAGIVGWCGWAFWHIEKSPFSNRRRIMFYSLKDMFEMQRHSEHAGASILGIFPSDMGEYFATAKHILNEAGHERLVPVFQKFSSLANFEILRGRFCGKEIPDCSIHLVDENTQFSDHSMWPGRIFITLFGQNNVAVDDVGLATIVSHLLAHSYLNHRGEVMSFGHFEEIARHPTPVLALLAIASKQIRIPAVLYCLCVGALYVCGQEMYSKMLEREADIWGLELMRIAGYDVTKATQYWEHKMGYDLQVIHSANIERAIEGTDAGTKKFLGDVIESYRQDVKMNQIHIETIQRYIKDKGILPFLVEEPRTTEDPPKPTETKDESDSDVPESKN